MRRLALVICSAGLVFGASDPITDEALRMEALRAVFPGMQISATGKRVNARERDWSSVIPFPDALAGEQVYRVAGKPQNEVERCNADGGIGRISSVREVALRLYAWPRLSTDFVAVLQYAFAAALPTMPCSSIGLVAHIARRAGRLVAEDQFLLDSEHHWSIPGIELVDLTGDGIEELVVDSDFGGAYVSASKRYIFDLSRARLALRAEADSHVVRLEPGHQQEFTFVLDRARSRSYAGTKFCFINTVYRPSPPRVTNVCLPARDSLNPR
jgi:hypothetical protein